MRPPIGQILLTLRAIHRPAAGWAQRRIQAFNVSPGESGYPRVVFTMQPTGFLGLGMPYRQLD